MKKNKFKYGGMALIEGVMMRGPVKTAMAVRKPDGSIQVETVPNESYKDKWPILKLPFLRGITSLVESMVFGMKMLNKSASWALEDDEEELTTGELIITALVAFGLAIGLFMLLPAALVYFSQRFIESLVVQNVIEGAIRIIVFLLYVYSISRTPDIKRVLMYHGAEHKTISAHEADVPLTPFNIRAYPRLHPRCGTSFLLLVMIISIIVHIFLGNGTLVYRLVSRIIAFPIVAGISYEFLQFTGRNTDKGWVRVIIKPGLQLQRLTTSEPDLDMLEVSSASLLASMPLEERLEEEEKIVKAGGQVPAFVWKQEEGAEAGPSLREQMNAEAAAKAETKAETAEEEPTKTDEEPPKEAAQSC